MTAANRMFILGGTFMAGLSLAAKAAHWFITPAAYAASDGRTIAVVVQACVGLALAAFALLAKRSARGASAQNG